MWPTSTPFKNVVSRSSIVPRERVTDLPSHDSGRSTSLRNQAIPSKSGRPLCSQLPGSFMAFQALASNLGSDQVGCSAEPGSFFFHQAAIACSKRPGSLPASAFSARTWATALLKSSNDSRAPALAQASATVPPQEEWIRPIGTPSSR